MTEATEERSDFQPCDHAKTITDPELGQTFCENCGLLLPEGPVRIGSRLVPYEEFLRRLRKKSQELDRDMLLIQQRKHQLLSVAAKIRDKRCQSPGCLALAVGRSQWCPYHQAEHKKAMARERQRHHRTQVAVSPASVP